MKERICGKSRYKRAKQIKESKVGKESKAGISRQSGYKQVRHRWVRTCDLMDALAVVV